MPQTAVVNRRRRRRPAKRRRSRRRSTSRRRRNPRDYGAATTTTRRRRNRRSNATVRKAYSSGGYRRRPNPRGDLGLFDFQTIIDITPAATFGSLAGRWATKLAGPFDDDDEPTFKHAIAIWLAASLGGQLIGNVLNDRMKGLYAAIGTLAYGGDLFVRKVFLKDSDWFQENVYLGQANNGRAMAGFQDQSVLGQGYTDATGNRWVLTQGGWQLAGAAYQLPADPAQGQTLAGFQDQSVLGRRPRASSDNSFGYA